MTNMLVLTSSPRKPITKTVTQRVDAVTGQPVYAIQQFDSNIKYYSSKDWPVKSFEDLQAALTKLMHEHSSCVVRGAVKEGVDRSHHERRKSQGDGGCIEEVDQQWVALDVDNFPLAAIGASTIYEAPALIKKLLPTCFAEASCFWKFSSSTGFKSKNTVSVHFWFWLSSPISNKELKDYFNVFNSSFKELYGVEQNLVDTVFFDSIQIHYTASPVLVGFEDPLKVRYGIIPGKDSVDLQADIEPQGTMEEVESSVHKHLLNVGSDKKGFHGPLLSASMVAARIWPGVTGMTQFKVLARDAIARADKEGKSQQEIDRYLSDAFLENLFKTASSKLAEGSTSIGDPRLVEYMRRMIYVRVEGKYYDSKSGIMVNNETLIRDAQRWTDGKRIADSIFHNGAGARVDMLAFRPDYQPKKFFTEGGVDYYNRWEGRLGSVIDEQPIIEPMVRHAYFLCDDRKEEAEQLLDFIAFTVANPGKKVRWAPVISGKEGTGKSTIKEIVKRVYRDGSVREITVTDLESNFNGYMEAELLFLEEVYANSKVGVAEKLKAIITESVVDVNKKFVPQYKTRNYTNLMIFTNQTHPLYMSDSDRRYLVIRSESKPKNAGYYEGLYEWINHEKMPDWMTTWAHTRNMDHFSPTKPPVVTEAKKKVIAASRPAAEQLLVAAMKERIWPMQHDAITLAKLVSVLGQKYKGTMSTVEKWIADAGVPVRSISGVRVVVLEDGGREDRELLEMARSAIIGSETDFYNGGVM